MKATDMTADLSVDKSNETASKEKISPYDWEAFGFKVHEEDMDCYFLSGSSLMNSILKYIDENGDGTLTEQEFFRYKGNQYIRNLLSKLIYAHRSEWAYSGDAFAALKNEAANYYDDQIKILNPQGNENKEIVQTKRDEDLKRFEEKVNNLTFLDQITLENKSSLPQGCFYYFHPFAFVEQMKRMDIGGNIEYHIYSDSQSIEKHIPLGYNENSNTILKFAYYYHIGNQQYDIATLNAIVVPKYSMGSKTKPDSGEYATRKNNKNKNIYFIKQNTQITLVELPKGMDIKVGSKLIKYKNNTQRNYCAPDVAASLFGALAECSYNFIVFNGCTDAEGIGAPSVSHAGGYNIDFRYIRKDKNTNVSFSISGSGDNNLDIESQNKFIDALNLFGWGDVRGYNPTNDTNFKAKHLTGHQDHLHCQGYRTNMIIK